MADDQVKGVDELIKKLYEFGADVGSKSTIGAVRAAGKEVLKIAKTKIPVGKKPHRTYLGDVVAPGYSSRHLLVRTRKLKNGNYAAYIGPTSKAFYATAFVERGTMRVPARPWLVPSLEQAQPETIRIMREFLLKAIQRQQRK